MWKASRMKSFVVFAASTGLALANIASAQTAPSPLTPAQEQAYTIKLRDCFTAQTTGADRTTFARWFVAILASAPKVQGVAAVEPGVKDQLDRQVASIFTRIITKDCAAEARPLWQARSNVAFRVAGEALGRLAMQEVTADAEGQKIFAGYASHINPADFRNLDK